jgi:hypothetical protein
MGYTPFYKDEVFGIIEAVEREKGRYRLSKNLWLTDTLCWCFLQSIFAMIRGDYAVLEVKSLVSHRVIGRSLLEHMIDMRLLALHAKTKTNQMFAEYPKVILYSLRYELSKYKNERRRIEDEYRKYVQHHMPQLVQKHTKQARSIASTDWNAVDKEITGRLVPRGWYGRPFTDKVNEIVAYSYALRNNDFDPQSWGRLYQQAEAENRNRWKVIPFGQRLELFLGIMQRSVGDCSDIDVPDLDQLLPHVLFFWRFLSTYTHPTVFSTIPHYNATKGTFELEYGYSDDGLREAEILPCLALTYAVPTFALSLDDTGKSWLNTEFEKMISRAPRIKSWLFKAQ